MKSLILSLAALAAVPLHATIEREVEKKFNVSGPGVIRLETHGGSITVQPGADGVVTVTAHEHIRASSDEKADELLKDLELKFAQSGNDVEASAHFNRAVGGFHFGPNPVEVDFVATVPAGYATDLKTSGGNVTIGDLAGNVQAHTSGGNVRLGKMGGTVKVHTSGGDIGLDEARGEVALDTSGGTIRAGRVAGPADLSTSGGNISIDAVEQRIVAHTSGGNVRANIVGPIKDECNLSTSGGTVKVVVDKTAAFRLDASTSGGTVNANGLTITLQSTGHNRSKLAGDVNGGGPLLKLHSSGGNIDVSVR